MRLRTEVLLVRLWNWLRTRRQPPRKSGLLLGYEHSEARQPGQPLYLSPVARTEHIAILGKTGTGKSSLMKHIVAQDIRDRRGFCFFDLHGDATPFLLDLIAAEERTTGEDLSANTIVIEPADPEFSVGINLLQPASANRNFVQIAEFAQILKRRWRLDSLGARTEELLRNSLYLLSESGLTLLEIAPLLSNSAFRSQLLTKFRHSEIQAYFESRFNSASEAMQGSMRDPILNKISAFTVDPHFRHILGQSESTFSFEDALASGRWIIITLDKGRLGEEVHTLGALLLSKIKSALFSRRSRRLFTIYCDEVQNLLAFDTGLESLLSESRKFGISICTANQFLDQLPAPMRSAIVAIGTQVYFQLSPPDADTVAKALDGPQALCELLKNQPHRHFVLKSGSSRFIPGIVPDVKEYNPRERNDLYNRSRERWARSRAAIEHDIARRRNEANRTHESALQAWD